MYVYSDLFRLEKVIIKLCLEPHSLMMIPSCRNMSLV